MAESIKITNASNRHKFICFKIKGLEDGIIVGLTPGKDNCLSIGYQGENVIVPFDANAKVIDELNKQSDIVHVNCNSHELKTNWDIETENG